MLVSPRRCGSDIAPRLLLLDPLRLRGHRPQTAEHLIAEALVSSGHHQQEAQPVPSRTWVTVTGGITSVIGVVILVSIIAVSSARSLALPDGVSTIPAVMILGGLAGVLWGVRQRDLHSLDLKVEAIDEREAQLGVAVAEVLEIVGDLVVDVEQYSARAGAALVERVQTAPGKMRGHQQRRRQRSGQAASETTDPDNVRRLPQPDVLRAARRLATRVIRGEEDNPEDTNR